jgi:hypothetical protein
MLGSLARRERRPLWGWLSFFLLAAICTSLFIGARARSVATEIAIKDAELTAQTELAPLLQPEDLAAPIVGERAEQLSSEIDDSIISVGPVDRVRIYSSIGRILYAGDPQIVGTRPTYLRDLTFQVANGEAQAQIHSGLLQTFVPIWLTPGGTVVVAEMSQAFGPIVAEATGTTSLIALVCGILLIVSVAMIVRTSLERPSTVPIQVYQRQTHSRTQSGSMLDQSTPQPAGLRALEEQRHAAEARAKAAEENHRAVQAQLKETLGQLKELELTLAMQETQPTSDDSELSTLREQLTETADRLHKAELDNSQLRERMALRQRELEDARHQAASVRADGSDAQELARRLAAAEKRAEQLAAEMERMEAELDFTTSTLRMSKLSEALRELQSERDIEIAVEDEDQDGEDRYSRLLLHEDDERLTAHGKAR